MLNRDRIGRDVIVIGAAAGGVTALHDCLSRLPADMPALIAIVLHRSSMYNRDLARVMAAWTRGPLVEPHDRDPVRRGTIYLAPADRHLTLEEVLRVSREPKEHSSRPAVDPLFRSAARTYGSPCRRCPPERAWG